MACVLLVHCQGYTQGSLSPGGVKGASIWLISDTNAKSVVYKSKIPQTDSVIAFKGPHETQFLNFNEGLLFKNGDLLNLPLGDSSIDNATFFTVYRETAVIPDEKTIWYLATAHKVASILTTKRLADLDSAKYLNFTDLHPGEAKIATYAQLKRKDTVNAGLTNWLIGQKPVSPILPVSSFAGIIPELIAYKRSLASEERIKVTTYLAVKYGITLSDPNPIYLSSSGKTLWDGNRDESYYHHIAGIGRDDSTGLSQLKSTSSSAPGLLTISTDQFKSNESYIVWGDNNELLTISNKNHAGSPPLLKKKWLLTVNTNGIIKTDVVLNTKKIDVLLPAKPFFWLAVDRSGTGHFEPTQTEYTRMDSIDAEGLAYFKNVIFDDKTTDKLIIGFYVGNSIFSATTVSQPSCIDPSSGALNVKIVGGAPPFNISLSDRSGKQIYSAVTSNYEIPITGVIPGEYDLLIKDKTGSAYSDMVLVNNSDAIVPVNVLSRYSLKPGQSIQIAADSLMPVTTNYKWTGPKNFISYNPQIAISQPGRYELECTTDQCSYYKIIEVAEAPVDLFNIIKIFPNPTTGSFATDITLSKAAPVTISVYSVTGVLVNQWKVAGKTNYRVNGYLRTPGSYTVYYQSNNITTSRKITVQ